MQAISTIDDPKYSHCHMVDDVSMKQPHATSQQQYATSSISVGGGGCHAGVDEVAGDNMTTVIKSEDGVSHSFVLPPFMH